MTFPGPPGACFGGKEGENAGGWGGGVIQDDDRCITAKCDEPSNIGGRNNCVRTPISTVNV